MGVSPESNAGTNKCSAPEGAFLRFFQKALESKDCNWLATHIDFPLKLESPSKEVVLIRDEVMLQLHFDLVFPPTRIPGVLSVRSEDLNRTLAGIEIGATGFVCLEVPDRTHTEDSTLMLYRVPLSKPPDNGAQVTIADRVFFIQFKDALRHQDAQWLAAHTLTPFHIQEALGLTQFDASEVWIREHYEEIWNSPLSKISPSKARHYRDPRLAAKTLKEIALETPTSEIWRNWRGARAGFGVVWFDNNTDTATGKSTLHLVAIHMVGHSSTLSEAADSP